MNLATIYGPRFLLHGKRTALLLLAFVCVCGTGYAQGPSAKSQDASAKAQDSSGKLQNAPQKQSTADGRVVGDKQAASDNQSADKQGAAEKQESPPPEETEAPAVTLPATSTPEDRNREAWTILTAAAGDLKHTQTRIQALAALGQLRSPRSSKMIADAMREPDVDVRTAAALAAGETKDRNLTTNLRNLLDDKEPQVAFAAAMTLWKMNDKSGEDILMSVAEGDRSTSPTMMHGTAHKISRDLHDPAKLARLGAMQGAYMLLGPFGYGITAFQFIHQSGGDYARASAIEQISQEKIEPVRRALIADLGDKDLVVRVAALKGLMGYHDNATSMAVYKLLVDTKYPVRLTAAAAYLRTTGTPGPPLLVAARLPGSAKH
jgi:HEAT repeat protein